MISRNIILTGFMGTGKSAAGEILARRLGRRFLDTDTLVERLSGMTVPEIFKLHGEAYFRDRESAVVASLERYPQGRLVVATGGGAVLRESNRRLLRQNGVVVLLTASLKTILERVGEGAGRPLLDGARLDAKQVCLLLRERERYYRECDLTVDTTNISPSAVAEEIIARLTARA